MRPRSRKLTQENQMVTISPFETVYQLTKGKNVLALKRLLALGLSLDVLDSSALYTPAAKLAAEGDKDAVALLFNLGVNLNKIAEGYAIAGDHREVEKYRQHYGAAVNEIARGYALGGHTVEARNYIRDHQADPNGVVFGHAYRGDSKEVEAYLSLYKLSPEGILQAATGCLLGKQPDCLQQLYNNKEAEKILHSDEAEKILISTAAIANNAQVVQNYLTQGDALIDIPAYGYAMAGNNKELQKIQARANAAVFIKAFAMSGRSIEVENTRQANNLNPSLIAEAYAFAAHLPQVELYCLQYGANLKKIAPALYESGAFKNPALALRSLSFIDDPLFRNTLVQELKKLKLLAYKNLEKIALRAGKINQLMKQQTLNYDQALAWTMPELQTWFLQAGKKRNMIEDVLLFIAPYLTNLTYQESGELHDKMLKQRQLNKPIKLERQTFSPFFRPFLEKPTPKPNQHLPARRRLFPPVASASVNEKVEKNKKPHPPVSKKK